MINGTINANNFLPFVESLARVAQYDLVDLDFEIIRGELDSKKVAQYKFDGIRGIVEFKIEAAKEKSPSMIVEVRCQQALDQEIELLMRLCRLYYFKSIN